MKGNVNGCSTCPAGAENYERFYSHISGGYRYQYDYRAPDGKLFSTVAKSLEICRRRRDNWLTQLSA